MASATYNDCPSCKQDWGMGLMYLNGKLAVECIDCGFRGPDIGPEVEINQRDEQAIAAWLALPRTAPIEWTPPLRTAKIMRQLNIS